MNSKIIVSIFCFVTFVTNMSAQTATSINIQDTRAVNDLPNFIGFGMRADFKQIATIGVPGEGYYSTNITIAPWNTAESSGGKNHQMNFNAGGLFYRNAFPTDPQWGTWRQVLMTNENGNVGIGTSAPSNDQGWNRVLDVSGTYHSKILATSNNSNFRVGIFSHNAEWHGGGGFIGTESDHTLFLIAGYDPKMTILTNGNVGIGTPKPTSKLTVAGNINSREVKVSVDAGADFVFDKDYALPSLQEVEKFVTENKHLPEIASAKEMQKEGINLSEMNIKLLQKIEELTLYVIEQEKKNTNQSKEIEKLKEEKESYKIILERLTEIEKKLR